MGKSVDASKPAAQGADTYAGPCGDLLHAGVGSGLAEGLAGGVQDGLVVADGVTARGGRRGTGPC
jgi:hypothetical protein